jgi:hypothetical protein
LSASGGIYSVCRGLVANCFAPRRSHKERRNHLFSHFIIVAPRFLFISAAKRAARPVLITGPDREHIPIWESARIYSLRPVIYRAQQTVNCVGPKNGAARGVYRDVRMNVSFIGGARQKILFALKYGRAKSYLLCARAVQCNVMGASLPPSRPSIHRKSRRRWGVCAFYPRQATPGESTNVSMCVHSLIYGAASVLRNNPCALAWKLFLFPANAHTCRRQMSFCYSYARLKYEQELQVGFLYIYLAVWIRLLNKYLFFMFPAPPFGKLKLRKNSWVAHYPELFFQRWGGIGLILGLREKRAVKWNKQRFKSNSIMTVYFMWLLVLSVVSSSLQLGKFNLKQLI